VVGVAEWLRRQVVALEIEGSNPSVHPNSTAHTAIQESPLLASTNRKHRQPHQRVSFAIFGILVAALVAMAAAVACGGSSDSKAQSMIQKFLDAGQSPGTTNDVMLDKLPPGLPDGLPSYPGAKVLGSVVTIGSGTKSLTVLRETSDSVSDVYAFYEQALGAQPWQIDVSTYPGKIAAVQFSSVSDPNLAGAVVIQPTGDGGDSVIYATVQTPSTDATTEPFKLEPSKPLPSGWPSQMPIYPNATVADTGWSRSQGSIEWQISLLAQTTPKDIIDYYRTELTNARWNVTDEPEQGAMSTLSFKDELGAQPWTGSVSAQTFAQDPSYAAATLQLQIGSSATPQPSQTPSP
jgi:hypothetical protein